MKIIAGILLSLVATHVSASTPHPSLSNGKSTPKSTQASQPPASITPEQTIILTLSSLRHIVTTQCQAMTAAREAQQALADALRGTPK